MKKTKKRALYIIAALLGALFVLSCLVGFAACGGSSDDCADGHTWDAGEVTTAATCTETGVKTYTCTVCGDTKTETIAALGHDYQPDASSTSNKDATCTTEGAQALKCSRCGATTTETIPATGIHTLVKTEAKDATCTEAGNNAYWTCSVCNKVFSDEAGTTETTVTDQTIAALGHDLTTTTTDATCTAGGTTTETCSRGDYTNTTTTSAALGHELVGTYVPASTEGGATTEASWTYACSVCNDNNVTLSADTLVKSLTLQATDEDSLRAAGLWGGVELEVTPVIDVATTTENNGTITVNTDNIRIGGGDTPMDKDVVLNADIDMTSYTIIVRCECVMDLNGHTITRGSSTSDNGVVQVGASNDVYGDLTLKDSSTNQSGKISGQYGVVINGIVNNDGNVSKFTMVSGTVEGSVMAVSTNGQNKNNGNTYDYGAEEIIIQGGTVKGEGLGIYLPNGSLTVTDGEISGATGIEIKAGSATISGGKISTTVTDGLTSVTENSNGASSSGYSVAIVYNSSYNVITSVTISGGTLTGPVYCDQSVENVVTISGVNIVVSAFDAFSWAMTLDDATVILGNDIVTDSLSTIYVQRTITLDLNGFTLKQTNCASNGWGLICVEDGGNLTIEDTSTEGTGAIKVAAYYALTVKGSQDAATTKLTIESGTIECWGYVISTNASASDGVRIYGNVEITVNGGALTSTDNQAIYLTAGKLTVNGGTITGDTGIEIRGGHADVTGGTINTNVEEINSPDTSVTGQSVSSGYSIAVTWNSSYSDGTLTIDMSKVSMNGMIYMKNTEDSSSVLADSDTTWGNYDRVIGERGNDDDLYYMGGVEFAGSEATATLSEDGYTYVISGTSASMTDDQLKAYWVTDDTTDLSTDYIAIAVVAGIGETVTITTHNGDVYTTNGGTTGKAKPFVINVTDYDEDTSEFFMNVVVTDSDGNLKAAYVVTLGEISSSAAEQP